MNIDTTKPCLMPQNQQASLWLEHLGPVNHGMIERAVMPVLHECLPRLLAWTLRTYHALPEHASTAPGYRDLAGSADQQLTWLWPRSNQAERISVWLLAARHDPSGPWLDTACRYADAMLDDPVRGIYVPSTTAEELESGHGLVWYWRDAGCYMTNYTMRVPPAMLDLYDATGDRRYWEAARRSGEAMLRLVSPVTGLPRDGWAPPGAEASRWVHSHKINCRVGYAVYTYARLYQATHDHRYTDAMAMMIRTLLAYQRQDGALPSELRIDRIEPANPVVKGHFLSYVLNGTSAAAMLMPEWNDLKKLSLGVADYLMDACRRCGGPLYGDLYDDTPNEQALWRTVRAESAIGLLNVAGLTDEPAYRSAALRSLFNAAVSAFDCPAQPDLHGGIPLWSGPTSSDGFTICGYHHFHTLAAMLVAEGSFASGSSGSSAL